MPNKRVLSIGQCAVDHAAISRTMQDYFDAQVIAANGLRDAVKELNKSSFSLICVNRLLDADGSSGLEVIKELKKNAGSQTPIMLVSNYEDAQKQAEAAGAVPGFGKASLGEAEMLESVRPFLS